MTNKIIYETSKEGNGVFNVKTFDDGTVDTTDDDNMYSTMLMMLSTGITNNIAS